MYQYAHTDQVVHVLYAPHVIFKFGNEDQDAHEPHNPKIPNCWSEITGCCGMISGEGAPGGGVLGPDVAAAP